MRSNRITGAFPTGPRIALSRLNDHASAALRTTASRMLKIKWRNGENGPSARGEHLLERLRVAGVDNRDRREVLLVRLTVEVPNEFLEFGAHSLSRLLVSGDHLPELGVERAHDLRRVAAGYLRL